MNKTTISLISIILFTILFTGCIEETSKKDNGGDGLDGNTFESRFIGEWEFQDAELSLILKSNGSFYGDNNSYTYYIGTWKVKGNQFCTTPEKEDEGCFRYDFFDNYKTLVLYVNEDNPTVLKKQ